MFSFFFYHLYGELAVYLWHEERFSIMPNTHRRRDETVLSRRRRRCEHEFATSSRRLPTDSVDNLEADQTDSIAGWLREFW